MLKLHDLNSQDHLVFPEQFTGLKLDSPALALFTDFKIHRPGVMDDDISIHDAEVMMQRTHLTLSIVIDRDNELIGVLDSSDLYTDQALSLCAARSRNDVSVRELMRGRERLKALDLDALAHASISDLVQALQHEGVRHCLVVEPHSHHIRGLIAASELAARLHLTLDIQERASFLDIFRVVSHQH